VKWNDRSPDERRSHPHPENLRYRFGAGFAPVAPVADTANVLVVHPSLDVKTVADLIALAKGRPGEIFYAARERPPT
jgi:tripartite-type tricarboxylate transporter receptor subunit TctC